MNLRYAPRRQGPQVRLGAAHGYRIDGDVAFLNAELNVPPYCWGASWALELWACEQPYAGGLLTGLRVARASVQLPTPITPCVQRVEAHADAVVPARAGEHWMVLVLVEADLEGAHVHDFANYAQPERFQGPRLEGCVSYAIDGREVVLEVEAISNPRPVGNVSGTLSLELWALASPYTGGSFEGVRVAFAHLPGICGQHEAQAVARRTAFEEPPPGRWHMTLMLREWTAAHGFTSRDYRGFPLGYERRVASAVNAGAAGSGMPELSTEGVLPALEKLHLVATPTPRPVAPRVVQPGHEPVSPRAAPTRLSIHSASVEALARLEGLNMKIAREIVKARPFSTINELVKVRGIGKKTLRRIRSSITL
jgi:competence ComEA-like helix-hairpin-helix protein